MSEIKSGCPHIKWDGNRQCEICAVTGKPTGVSLTCDFDYDECKEYRKDNKSRESEDGQ